MNSTVAKVTGKIEESQRIEGYIAKNADGTYLGDKAIGILVVRDPGYLKRLARPDATLHHVTLVIHDEPV